MEFQFETSNYKYLPNFFKISNEFCRNYIVEEVMTKQISCIRITLENYYEIEWKMNIEEI